MRQIQKLAKKVGEESDDLNRRLNDFEGELTQPDGAAEHVSDADLVFLKKEVSRYRSAISAVSTNKDQVLRASQQINQEVTGNRVPDIQQEDLQ